MCKSKDLDSHKFWIKVEDIFTINGRGQVIAGETNNPYFMGKVCCGHETFEIIGCEVFHDNRDRISGFLVNTFDLTDVYKGKIFTNIDSEED